jgi:nitrogen fixation NifU-like protein
MDLEQSRQILLEESRSNKNGEFPQEFTHEGDLRNPICGDHVHIKLRIENKIIAEAGFKANACAICSASAALLTKGVGKRSVSDAIKITQDFEKNILESPGVAWPDRLKLFQPFEHLKVNPARKTCALLPFVALRSILKRL